MAAESIVIVVSENGSRVVRRSLEDIGASANSAQSAIEGLKEALAAIGIGLALKEITDAIDTFTNLENRLKAVGNTGDELGVVYQRLLDVSKETHSSMESTVNLYARLEQSMKALGHSTNEAIEFTETLSAAAKLSGASSQELKYGIQDLAHGLSGGAINGRELNGILREMPSVAALIQKGLGMNGITGNLKTLAHEGKLSAEALLQAFAAVRPEIMEKLRQRVMTVGDAVNDVKNAFMTWVGTLAQAGDKLGAVTSLLSLLATNMSTVMNVVTALGVGFLFFYGLPAIIGLVTGAVVSLTVAMWANPMLALASVMAASITALVMFRDEIILIEGYTASLGDLMRAAWEKIGPAIQHASDQLKEFFSQFKSESSNSFQMIDAVRFFTNSIDIMIAVGDFLGKSLRNMWDTLPGVMREVMANVANIFIDAINGMVSAAARGMNAIGQAIENLVKRIPLSLTPNGTQMSTGFTPFSTEGVIERFAGGHSASKEAEERGQQLGENLMKGLQNAVHGKGGTTALMDGLLPRAEEIGNDRRFQELRSRLNGASGLNDHGANTVVPDEKKKKGKKDTTESELDKLLSKWDEVDKAIIEVRKAEETLGKGVERGLITPEKAAEVLKNIRESISDKFLDKYNSALKAAHDLAKEEKNLEGAAKAGLITREQANHALEVARLRAQELLDPLGKITKEYGRELAVLQLTTKEQEVENSIQKTREALLSKGVILTVQQTQALRDQLVSLHNQRIEYNYQNEILNKINEPMEKLRLGTEALNRLFAQGKISAGQYNKELETLKADSLAASTDMVDGFERAWHKMSAASQDFASQAESAFNSVQGAVENAFSSLLKTGKMDMKSLLSTVEEICAQMIIKFLMVKAFSAIAGVGGLFGSAAGSAMSSGESAFTSAASSNLSSMGSSAASAGSSVAHFATGGEFQVGGSGGTDSQLVAFRASPNETVSVRTPDQMNNSGGPTTVSAPDVHVKVINSIDPTETLAHMNSSAGERVILNAIQRNPNAVRKAIGR